jgi:hypothetical protein
MPVKLPAPDFGTDEHPGPKSIVLAAPPEAPEGAAADDEDDAIGEAGAAEVLDGEELHAAAPVARLAAMPDTASRRRFFMVLSLVGVSLDAGFPVRGWMAVAWRSGDGDDDGVPAARAVGDRGCLC